MSRFALSILAALVLVSAARADILPPQRDVVVVVELSTHAIAKYQFFYKLAEDFSIRKAYELLSDSYRNVYVLTAENATLDNFVKSLGNLAGRSDGNALDVVIELHGAPRELMFHEGGYGTDRIRDRLRADKRIAPKLRAVYSGACYGESHIDDFLAAGFKVASGAVKVNANGMFDFPTFLRAWAGGETFSRAQELGNNPFWVKFFDEKAQAMGMGDANSFKEVRGSGGLGISSPFQTSLDTPVPTAERHMPHESLAGGVVPELFAEALAEARRQPKRSAWLEDFRDFFDPSRAVEEIPSGLDLPTDGNGLIRMTDEIARRFAPSAEDQRKLRDLLEPR